MPTYLGSNAIFGSTPPTLFLLTSAVYFNATKRFICAVVRLVNYIDDRNITIPMRKYDIRNSYFAENVYFNVY